MYINLKYQRINIFGQNKVISWFCATKGTGKIFGAHFEKISNKNAMERGVWEFR